MATNTIHLDSYKVLAQLLREAREAAGLTQADLAAKLGEDQSFVSKVERRERRLDLEELRLYCEAVGMPLQTFVQQWTHRSSGKPAASKSKYPTSPTDREWTEAKWRALIEELIGFGLLTFGEIAALTLGHLNPSQVGTSIASKKTFQAHFPPRKCWQAVRDWHFNQRGKCIDCGSRLELQADHIQPREKHGDKADRLENMTLRCRRCYGTRRPSHKQGGLTFLTAEAALMWLLFTKRPSTYQSYKTLCRSYGLTMADIRFQEAWAMARWLEAEGLYTIEADSQH